jgi:putative phosphoesterase
MRVAALYDIHGNLPALEAVLEEVRHAGVDRIVVGGDVLPGPMPRETLGCLLSLDVPAEFIYGNGEVAVLEQLAGRASPAVPEPYRPAILWNAGQVRGEYGDRVAGWPLTLKLETPGSRVLFCHATPRNDNEIFTALTPEERLLPVFDGLDASVIVCGHTHMPFDRTIGRTRVVNAGSVGMPFGAPGADWLLLGDEGLQFRHTAYDLTAAAARVRASPMPWPEDFATRYILQPPTAAEMLDVFTRASI